MHKIPAPTAKQFYSPCSGEGLLKVFEVFLRFTREQRTCAGNLNFIRANGGDPRLMDDNKNPWHSIYFPSPTWKGKYPWCPSSEQVPFRSNYLRWLSVIITARSGNLEKENYEARRIRNLLRSGMKWSLKLKESKNACQLSFHGFVSFFPSDAGKVSSFHSKPRFLISNAEFLVTLYECVRNTIVTFRRFCLRKELTL